MDTQVRSPLLEFRELAMSEINPLGYKLISLALACFLDDKQGVVVQLQGEKYLVLKNGINLSYMQVTHLPDMEVGKTVNLFDNVQDFINAEGQKANGVCSHGDHPCALGEDFCSEACRQCDQKNRYTVGCDNTCERVDFVDSSLRLKG
jgi:hypothetical protein